MTTSAPWQATPVCLTSMPLPKDASLSRQLPPLPRDRCHIQQRQPSQLAAMLADGKAEVEARQAPLGQALLSIHPTEHTSAKSSMARLRMCSR